MTFLSATTCGGYNRDKGTVGDGNLDNGTAMLNYNDMYTLSRGGSSPITWTVNADGTLNFTADRTFEIAWTPSRLAQLTLAGGTVTFNGPISKITNSPNSYVTFDAVGTSLTAEFGSDFPDLATVVTNIGDGLSFRSGAETDPTAKDNGDSTFTVGITLPPSGTVIFIQ